MRQSTPVKYAAKRSWVAGRVLLATVLALIAMMVMFGRSQAAECGGASWYVARLPRQDYGLGERFNQNIRMAAHKTLPLGTIVKVTEQRTGQSIKVTINDRAIPPGSGQRLVEGGGSCVRLPSVEASPRSASSFCRCPTARSPL